MISQRLDTATQFKYIQRGYYDTLVLIPGWANDYRIFSTLDLRFNYLLPIDFSPFTFDGELLAALRKNKIQKVSLFGFSLGGFVAAQFASRYKDLVDRVVLVSIRRRYKARVLKDIKRHLEKSKIGYLYKFYTQCFSKKEEMNWFKKNLLKVYCKEFDLSYLLETLNYLENTEIKPKSLRGINNITIIHGECDRIALFEEASEIKEGLPQARFVCIKDAGHIPFLRGDFANLIRLR